MRQYLLVKRYYVQSRPGAAVGLANACKQHHAAGIDTDYCVFATSMSSLSGCIGVRKRPIRLKCHDGPSLAHKSRTFSTVALFSTR